MNIYVASRAFTALCLIAYSAASGAFDPQPESSFGSGAIYHSTVQQDQRVLVSGYYSSIAGENRLGIARLLSNGAIDSTFVPDQISGSDPDVGVAAQQSDGKVVIGGRFSAVDGIGRPGVARLNVDGSLDTSFSPTGPGTFTPSVIAIQPDGKIVIGGRGTLGTGVDARNGVIRLNGDGTVDTQFDAGILSTDRGAAEVALLEDGRMLIGGGPLQFSDRTRSLVRVNSDGSLDPTFDPNPNETVFILLVQDDGRVVLGGDFDQVAGVSRGRIARVNEDGSIDASFDSALALDRRPRAAAIQNDNKLLIGGEFTAVVAASGVVLRNRLVRLNSNGSVDESFDANITGGPNLYTIAVQADEKIIVGGSGLGDIGGLSRPALARLHPDGSLDNPGVLSVLPDPLAFGPTTVDQSSTRSLTLVNDGGDSLSLLSLGSVDAPFSVAPLGDSDCGSQGLVLQPDQTCTVEVTCSPGSTSNFVDTLAIESDTMDSPTVVDLSCQGTNDLVPQLAHSPALLLFGDVEVDTSAGPLTTTLANVGSATVEVTAIGEVMAPFARVGGDCGTPPFDLAVGQDCTLDYDFTPTAVGSFEQSVSVASTGGALTIPLAGEGVVIPVLEASPTSVDFGDVDVGSVAPAQTVTLTSVGSDEVTITALGAASAPFARTGGTCTGTPINLSPSQSCTLIYRFAPPSGGAFAQTLTVDSNAEPVEIELLGTGVSDTLPPDISIDPEALAFTVEVGGSADQILIIGNSGEDTLDWSIDEGDCPLPAWLSASPMAGALVEGAMQDVLVAVDADTLAAGSHPADLCIDSNDPDTPTLTVPVTVTVTDDDLLFRNGFESAKP